MSAEHVLAMKIKQMYEHYTIRIQQRIVQQLSEKVRQHVFISTHKCSLDCCRSKH